MNPRPDLRSLCRPTPPVAVVVSMSAMSRVSVVATTTPTTTTFHGVEREWRIREEAIFICMRDVTSTVTIAVKRIDVVILARPIPSCARGLGGLPWILIGTLGTPTLPVIRAPTPRRGLGGLLGQMRR